jgi:hypothetical protein
MSLELKTLPTDIIQTVEEYPEFNFDTNEEFNLIFYTMNRKNCSLRFRTFSNNPTECVLDEFNCKPRSPGEGRKLLLDVLNAFKNEKPLLQTISLIVLSKPELINYYYKLGFTQDIYNPNYMEGNINNIIKSIQNNFRSGGKSKTRKVRNRKSKNKKNSKILSTFIK